MSPTDTFDPSENEGLIELKRRWECGHFGLDAHGVYGVDEAVDEAVAHLSLYDPLIEDKPPDPTPELFAGYDNSSTCDWPRETNIFFTDKIFRRQKICTICNQASKNSPCDECYQLVRAAAEMMTDEGIHSCPICDEGLIVAQICPECMESILGQ